MLPTFIIASMFLMTGALAQVIEEQPNPDMSSSEIRNGINVPVGFYYTQESTSYLDIPHFVDNPTPWNETNLVYDGDTIRAIFLESSPQSCNKFLNCPYISTQGIVFDNTTNYHFIIDLKLNDSIVSIANVNEYVFFQFFDLDSTNTTQNFPFLAINDTDVVTSATTSEFQNITFVTSPLDASFNRFEADLDISGFASDITFINFEISRNGNWEGDFEITNFQIQSGQVLPPAPAQASVTGTPAIIVQIIAIMVALGGIIGGGLLISQSGRIEPTIIITGFVVALISIVFAVAIVGLV